MTDYTGKLLSPHVWDVIDRRKDVSDDLRAAWQAYVEYRHRRWLGELKPRLARDLTIRYADEIVRKLKHLSDEEAAESLRRSIERNWIGVWPVREPGKADRFAAIRVTPLRSIEGVRWRP